MRAHLAFAILVQLQIDTFHITGQIKHFVDFSRLQIVRELQIQKNNENKLGFESN